MERLGPETEAIRPLLDLEAARDLLRPEEPGSSPAWFGQLMGGAQMMAFLIQVEIWLREYGVKVV